MARRPFLRSPYPHNDALPKKYDILTAGLNDDGNLEELPQQVTDNLLTAYGLVKLAKEDEKVCVVQLVVTTRTEKGTIQQEILLTEIRPGRDWQETKLNLSLEDLLFAALPHKEA